MPDPPSAGSVPICRVRLRPVSVLGGDPAHVRL